MDKEILNVIQAIPWSFFLQLSFAAIIALIFKKIYDNVASYIMFVSNEDLGRHVKVNVNNNTGIIRKYNLRFIYIELEENKNIYLIPINRWSAQKWEICNIKKDNLVT